jgi:8-oxo-dGTP pyrophosphatase MutT (NUDIX family)
MNTTQTIRYRPTARLLVLDEQQRILLFHINDTYALHRDYPGITAYWITPGGGVDPGESYEEAARRELWEETGIKVEEVGSCLWQGERILDFADGRTIYMQEQFFLVRVPASEIDMTNMLPYEKETHGGHRWWPLEELASTTETVLPQELVQILQSSLFINAQHNQSAD